LAPMHQRIWRRTGGTIAILVALSVVACSSSSASDASSSGGSAAASAGAAGAPASDSSATLAFESASLKVSTLDKATILARVEPARGQTVTFALLGDSLDASLDSAKVPSDSSTGLAVAVLTAPSRAASFSIRASLDPSVTSEIPVTVEQAFSGSLDVQVKYSGRRRVEKYAVVVYPDKDCSSGDLNVTTAGAIPAPATASLPVHVAGIPLSMPMAVVVNGDSVVHGCAVTRGGNDGSPLAIEVPLEDLAINLWGTTLDVALTSDEGAAAFKSRVDASIPAVVDALVENDDDLVDLLATMESVAPGSLQQEFASLRTDSQWDAVVGSYDTTDGSVLLRRQLRTWLTQGRDLLGIGPLFEATLSLQPRDYSSPTFTLTKMAGLDAKSRLLVQDSTFGLDTAANDQINWSSSLSWSHSNMLDMLAFAAASAELPGLADVPAQLAQKLSCIAFAGFLDQRATWTNASTRVCSRDCLATLCQTAIATMYQRARASVVGTGAQLTLFISASGTIAVDSNARPLASTGTWLGAISAETNPVVVSGGYASR
jgi:hypothetical protein